MNILNVAFKDLKRVFRSPFVLMMMFGAPLMIAGLLYFAFGGMTSGSGSFALPATRVVIANLDRPDPSGDAFKAGEMLIRFLQNKDLADVLKITVAADESSARSMVDRQQADAALIIPVNFTQAAVAPGQTAAVLLYQDPTLTIGPGILKDLINHFMDGFSGSKIAAQVTNAAVQRNGIQPDPGVAERTALQYSDYLGSTSHAAALHFVSPAGETTKAEARSAMIGPIMAGMLILFVFFMGANGAQSIIREHEEGTLARLFTPPASSLAILAGKFVGVFVTLIIQTTVLLVISILIFHIAWGKPLSVLLATLSLVIAATGFGVMLMSFIKNTRQTGAILGGVMTLTGMLGGLLSNGIPNIPKAMETIALLVPQGWAMQAWKLSLAGNTAGAILLPAMVLTIMGVLFFAIGFVSFRQRFI